MSGTIPPIPPPFGTSSGNSGSPNVNRVDMMPTTTDPINTTTTTNVSQSVVEENLPQLLDSRGGSHVTNVPAFDKEDFTSWKVRFLVFLDRLEPYLLKTLEDGPFIPMSSLSTSENPLPKCQNQWSNAESRLANQDKRLETHEGPSDIRDTKIAASRLKFNAFKSLEGEKVNGTFTRLKCLLNDLENNGVIIPKEEDIDSDVEEDQRTNNEFIADLNAEYHERALLENQKRFSKRSERGKYKGLKAKMAILTKRINDMTKGKSEKGKKEKEKSEKGLIAESFDWDDKSVSLDDEGSTKIMAFIAITKEEPSVGKADARSGQWVDITIKRKNLVNKFNLLKQEISLHKSELSNVKNNVSINCSLQNEVIRVNLENESLKDEIIDLKKVIEKWTCSKVTLDQLLSEQVLGNIVKALGRKGRRKEEISSKEVVFTKADESSSMLAPEITSDSESECDSQEPLIPFPKLIGATPSGTSESLVSLSDLTLNMVDLTLDTPVPKKTRPSIKASPAYVIKKKTEKSPVVPTPCFDKKVDSSTKQLLLTLIEDVKGLKRITSRGPKVVLKMILQKTQKGTIYNQNDEVVLIAPRRRDVYVIDMSSFNKEINACFFAKASSSVNWLWQKRLSHLNFKNINNLAKHNLVSGLPSLNFSKDKNCSACEKGKHHRASFKTKRSFSINKSLHLLHVDLFGPVKPQTISHNKYTLVIVDEYS
ncbi:retrovirus-related pol polyprotein from transposon TNT 1-94, partial [Tanacetum coccineum]